MAEELDDGEFWLPPKFLSDQDDDLVMDLSLPDVSESSDEDDYLLPQSLAHSSLSHKWSSNSPQSTLCNQGSSPDCTSPLLLLLGHSQMPRRGLLYVAAGEVAKIRQFQQPNTNNTFLNAPPPVFVPANNPNRANQLKQHQVMMKQQQGNIGRGQQQMSPRNSGANASNGRPLGLSPYAWPTLQPSRHIQQQYGSGMRAVFLQYPTTKGKCSGTGVFLPRPVGTPNQTLNKPACSTVLLPERIVQALNLNLKDMDAFPQLQNKSKTSNAAISSSDHDAAGKYHNGGLVATTQAQHRWNVAAIEPQAAPISNEVQLPQEWTY